MKIGIRKETQYPSERRAALTPDHVKEITSQGIQVLIEPAEDQRIFKMDEYIDAGAKSVHDLSECDIIFGVKEIPINDLIPRKPQVFFSHTIKGQNYNMPLLQAILDKNVTLIDYELVKNKEGFRIIFFGKFAGYAGIIDSLWLLGKRLYLDGISTPFSKVTQATEYETLSDAEDSLKQIGYEIRDNGLPENIVVQEVERYIVLPGQACAYKVGMLKINEMRENAEKKLGTSFDIKEFHNMILKNGAMPLSLLKAEVNKYIEKGQSI